MLGRTGSTLGTPEQLERDRRAVRIFESDPVQRAIRDLEAVYEAEPIADLPGARSSLKEAAAATGMAQSLGAVNKDADRPMPHWAVTAPHSWGDLNVPLSGLMIDDPDNVYRTIPVDGAAAYEIYGRVIGKGPTQETFNLHEHQTGAKKDEKIRTNQTEEGSIALHDLTLGPDGSFTITVDSSPANGRVNHLQLNPEAREATVVARDTLGDWHRDNPSQISVRRIGGPAVRPEATDEALAAIAAAKTEAVGRYWLGWTRQFFFSRPVNSVTHGFARVSGWGHVSCGHYNIADDEALVVHLERRDAAYLGFQVCDVWGQGQGTAYIEGLGSLNGSQARTHADGSYSYVIANSDPGVHNWLDTIGQGAGTFGIRWQKLPAGVSAGDAIRSMTVVKLKDLRQTLPADTLWVTPEERAAQLRERLESYQRRLNL